MSNKVIQFNNKQEEKCECPRCELVYDFNAILQDCESEDAFLACLRGLVDEASKLAIIEFLHNEIESKIDLVDHLEGRCECEDCECEE